MVLIKVRRTREFINWLDDLADVRAVARIATRLDRLAAGLFGDTAPVGEGVHELRIHYGPGYRVYFTQRGSTLLLLLCGGDKASQARDIKRAKQIAKEILP
jgi:putative addiction module killer protein